MHQSPAGHPLPPPEPGTRSLGTLPEDHVARGPDGLVETVDGRPVDEYLREVGEQRAEQFRRRRADGDFSRKEVGDVTSVVIDERTGEVVEADNGRPGAVIPDERVHPLLAERLAEMESGPGYPATNRDGSIDPGTRPYPHPDMPLGHAEVNAVNELSWRRGPHVDASVFAEMRVDNYAPFRGDGVRAVPCCANCAALLRGSPSNAGRFTGFPRGPHNFLPE